jgi:hypothetical protein
MAITPLPAAPETTDTPQQFNTKAFAWVQSLDTFVTEANAQATTVNADAELAEDWASKTDGEVDSTDYSSKAWAVGGTGVTDTASRGAAKEWATETSSTVDGTEYSAKEYAVGTQTRGTTGSAKDWATYTSGTVDGSDYSAKYHADEASTSASQAAASAAQSAASANVTQWSSGGTYAVGDNVFSPSDFQTYRNITGNNTATDPSSDATNWQRITGGAPGGSDTQIQYNSGGSFAGASGLVTDGSNLTLNAQGDLRLADSDSSNWVAFQAPATVASNVTWTLPSADGSNGQVLSTDGSGTLSWASGGGGGSSISAGDSSVAVTDAGTGKVEVTVDNVEVADFTTGEIVFNETGANQDFRVEGDTNANLIVADAGVDKVGIGTNTFNTNGGVLQVSNGISFPATQSACADANTLDDYEEGTWTPALSATGATFGYALQTGRYTKIGNTVVIHARVALSSASGGSGNVIVTGLPFTAAALISSNNVGQQGIVGRSSGFAGDTPMSIEVDATTTNASLSYRTASNGGTTLLAYADLGNSADFLFTVTYQAA